MILEETKARKLKDTVYCASSAWRLLCGTGVNHLANLKVTFSRIEVLTSTSII